MCSKPCQASRARTGRGSTRPRAWSPLPMCLCLAPPISAPTALAVSPRTLSLSPKPEITEDRRREQAPPSATAPELRPPWSAHPSHSQSAIAARLTLPDTVKLPKPSNQAEPRRRPQITLAGLLPLTGERGPGKSLRHFPIPRVYHLCPIAPKDYSNGGSVALPFKVASSSQVKEGGIILRLTRSSSDYNWANWANCVFANG
jgi:hypothetical protein